MDEPSFGRSESVPEKERERHILAIALALERLEFSFRRVISVFLPERSPVRKV
jgi:hypothetical protein